MVVGRLSKRAVSQPSLGIFIGTMLVAAAVGPTYSPVTIYTTTYRLFPIVRNVPIIKYGGATMKKSNDLIAVFGVVLLLVAGRINSYSCMAALGANPLPSHLVRCIPGERPLDLVLVVCSIAASSIVPTILITSDIGYCSLLCLYLNEDHRSITLVARFSVPQNLTVSYLAETCLCRTLQILRAPRGSAIVLPCVCSFSSSDSLLATRRCTVIVYC